MSKAKWTREEKVEKTAHILRLAAQGVPVRAIVARTGVSDRTVYRKLRANGIKPTRE